MPASRLFAVAASIIVLLAAPRGVSAARLSIELGNAHKVIFVGAVQRWDEDGNPRHKLDPKAKIDAPQVDAEAQAEGARWVFKDLPKGRYDLVILAEGHRRVEGFKLVAVNEFESPLPPDALIDEETRQSILDDIKKSPHYENKVEALCLGGDKRAVRVLVSLIRDKRTSYEKDFPGAATMRHEIWQYTWHYGAWEKEKRTKVLDRLLLSREELRQWTWRWDPKLGGIDVGAAPVTIKYKLP